MSWGNGGFWGREIRRRRGAEGGKGEKNGRREGLKEVVLEEAEVKGQRDGKG